MNKIFVGGLITFAIVGIVAVVGFLIWFPISPLNTVFNLSFQKDVSGTVYDCETTEPIVDATVTMSGIGWTWEDGLIWNKTYSNQTLSISDGSFDLKYNLGTELSAEKDGYLKAIRYTSSTEKVEIGMLKKTINNKSELSSYDCKLFSECIKTGTIDGVEISWDSCANP